MNNKKLWETHFEYNKCPCFVTDKETFHILYCNQEFLDLVGKDESIIGTFFYDVIPMEDCYMEEGLPDWEKSDYYESDSYNESMNLRFLMKATLDRATNSIFCIMIPSEMAVQGNSEFEKAMTRCVSIFETQHGDTKIMDEFSLLLSEYYNSEVAYVYRFEKNENKVVCISHHTAEDFVPNGGSTTASGMEAVIDWFQDKNTPRILVLDRKQKNADIHPTLLDVMNTFGVRNIAFCKVEDGKGNFVGIVGVSNLRDSAKTFDRRFIATIARFVSLEVNQGLAESTSQNQEHRDSLTGFFNRDGYSLVLKKVWADKPKTLGVISANINGLKLINENLGLQGGDKVIATSAKRLSEHFGFLFFRMSGDEFLGIAPNVDLRLFNEKVKELHNIMKAEENRDFSFGHAFGSGTIDLSKLTLESDTVMYINKQEYYATTKRQFDTVRDQILSDLLHYLENEEFMVYLQPQVRLSDGSTYGAEALIRRFDKTNQKMVFPDQFIPLYEQKSVIRHVDMFVVETVCKLLQQWDKENKAIPISVNLSRVTLQEYGIVGAIVEICDKYQVPHHLLVIEVTERVGLVENNVASSLINDFKENGFLISLDDFGCAYSNIVTLAQIEVDEVKIDKSLVDDITNSKKNHILVKNVLTMCNELDGASTLAEGIEYKEQADLLHQLHCHYGQGYLYSRPISIDDFETQYIKGNTSK